MAQYGPHRSWAADSWGSFDQLRREMDALLHRFGGAPVARPSGWRGVFPAVNLYENADAYLLTAELPGVAPDAIQVSLEGSTVTLQGSRSIEFGDPEKTSLHRRERQTGAFRRAFEVPASIDADKVEAVHRDGVLMLRLPKTPEHQPRQITVQAS